MRVGERVGERVGVAAVRACPTSDPRPVCCPLCVLQIDTETLQVLLMPFYQILVESNDKKLFVKTVACLLRPLLNAIAVTEEQPKALLPNVDMRAIIKDLFLIASSP